MISNIQTIFLFFALALTVDVSMAHFTLSGSRDSNLSGDSKYYPIGGGNVLRPGNSDCLSLPSSSSRSVAAGSTLSLPFMIGNGAAHVGPCKAGLYDRKSGQLVNDLGSMEDCVAKGATFNAQIPSNPGCQECVVKVEVTAMHIPTNPEYYDSCVDVDISGGSARLMARHAEDAPATPASSAAPASTATSTPAASYQPAPSSTAVVQPTQTPSSSPSEEKKQSRGMPKRFRKIADRKNKQKSCDREL
ncbi:hypothetical protein BKA69DRAFT_1128888 [Paraphysoderma sedebokerense]|nr:hypothetical protein BKA69DRAFT_1128888 [Paraphysoderma sedebokerense]